MMMFEIIDMSIYFASACAMASTISLYDSSIAIKISLSARKVFLIFSFFQPPKSKISVMAVVFQIYTYIMMSLFIASRFVSLDFLSSFLQNPNRTYTDLLAIQQFVLFPLSMLEIGVFALIKKCKGDRMR